MRVISETTSTPNVIQFWKRYIKRNEMMGREYENLIVKEIVNIILPE